MDPVHTGGHAPDRTLSRSTAEREPATGQEWRVTDQRSETGAADLPDPAPPDATLADEDIDVELLDEEAADRARRCYRAHGIAVLVADEQIGPLLEPGERVYATRRAAALDRRQPLPAPGSGLSGDLYVTSRRVIKVGCPMVALDLEDIREAELSGNRLLLMLNDGSCVALAVDQPRLLRVEISAARAARRRSPRGTTVRGATVKAQEHR